jgi:hypothetical protein
MALRHGENFAVVMKTLSYMAFNFTDLNTETSNHYEVFLPVLVQSPGTSGIN